MRWRCFSAAMTAAVLLCSSACAEGLKIVCSAFPQYDWCREIVGNDADSLILLSENGVDMHNYQPSARDIYSISQGDVLIVTGGESQEKWLDHVIDAAANPDLTVIRMIDLVDPLEETSMDEEEAEEGGQDEHVWLSLKNAAVLCRSMTEVLSGCSADNALTWAENCDAYCARLQALDERYQVMRDRAARSEVLVADRFPFAYLFADYDIGYTAAFSGCSAETEASFETMKRLIQRAKELELQVILTTETSDGKLAATIASGSGRPGAEILPLNAIQSVSKEQQQAGVTYLGIMEQNLAVLGKALDAAEE